MVYISVSMFSSVVYRMAVYQCTSIPVYQYFHAVLNPVFLFSGTDI